MYDCNGPMLVFVEQTLHPILGIHTGYIFAEYDVTYEEPRELFFSHIWEAQVYALNRSVWHDTRRYAGRASDVVIHSELELHQGMQLIMDPRAKPDRLTSLAYLFNYAETDGSEFDDHSDAYVYDHNVKSAKNREYRARAKARKLEQARVASLSELDFFGGE